jgi:hypothetical protein
MVGERDTRLTTEGLRLTHRSRQREALSRSIAFRLRGHRELGTMLTSDGIAANSSALDRVLGPQLNITALHSCGSAHTASFGVRPAATRQVRSNVRGNRGGVRDLVSVFEHPPPQL